MVSPEVAVFLGFERVLNGLVTKSVTVRRDDENIDDAEVAAGRLATRFDLDLVSLAAEDETCLELLGVDVSGDAQPDAERAIATATKPDVERRR